MLCFLSYDRSKRSCFDDHPALIGVAAKCGDMAEVRPQPATPIKTRPPKKRFALKPLYDHQQAHNQKSKEARFKIKSPYYMFYLNNYTTNAVIIEL